MFINFCWSGLSSTLFGCALSGCADLFQEKQRVVRSEEDEEQLEEDEKQEELRSEEVEEQYEDERQCKGEVTGRGSKERRSRQREEELGKQEVLEEGRYKMKQEEQLEKSVCLEDSFLHIRVVVFFFNVASVLV